MSARDRRQTIRRRLERARLRTTEAIVLSSGPLSSEALEMAIVAAQSELLEAEKLLYYTQQTEDL